jgi:hypothetical protein
MATALIANTADNLAIADMIALVFSFFSSDPVNTPVPGPSPRPFGSAMSSFSLDFIALTPPRRTLPPSESQQISLFKYSLLFFFFLSFFFFFSPPRPGPGAPDEEPFCPQFSIPVHHSTHTHTTTSYRYIGYPSPRNVELFLESV